MSNQSVVIQEPIEWTVTQVIEQAGGEGDGHGEPVYVAMQPVENDGQVEVQEVVIVTEGGDIQEVPQDSAAQIISIGSEEVIGEQLEPILDVSQIKIEQQYAQFDVPSPKNQRLPYNRSPGRPPRGRPPGRPPKTHFSYRSTRPKQEPVDHDEEYIPDEYDYPRSRGGKNLAKIPKIEWKSSPRSSSETESESDSEVRFPHVLSKLSKKKPKPRDFAHRLQWRNRDMLEAMKAVEEQKMTIRGAAKKYNVPYSTLKDRIHGRVRHGSKPGVKTILSPEEEEELAKFVRDMENAGFQLRCVDVRDRAAELLRLNHGHNSPYKEGSPGHNWFHGFVKRHPGLEFKRTVKKNIVPSISKQKHMLRRFYDITASIYKKYKLSHKSDRIFSVSELRIGGHFEATILYGAAANGSLLPPFVIFKGNALKLTSARQEYPEAFFTCSYDGRVNEDIFLWWFRDHFLKKVPCCASRPGVLFISRGVSDITMQLLQLAKEDRMNLVGMTFGISHLVQPLDDDVSDMIRNSFNKRFKKWQDENPGVQVTQKVVSQILRKVWAKINPEDVATKFTGNGIFPLNAYAITQDKLLTGAHILREMVERSPPRQPVGASPQLSGLNLLSALSSHEYATLDYVPNPRDSYSTGGRGNYSYEATAFETQSDEVSVSDSLTRGGGSSNDRENSNQGYKVVIKSQPGRENEVMVVPMTELGDGDVIEEQVEVGEEVLETEVISEPTEEQVQVLMEQQRELKRKRPRPSTDILHRNTDVQTEIAAARENIDQINKAIDSILDSNEGTDILHRNTDVQTEIAAARENIDQINKAIDSILDSNEGTVKLEAREVSTEELTSAGLTAPSPPSVRDHHPTILRIPPEKVQEEISKAMRRGSNSSSSVSNDNNSVQLSDFQGNDIKIQIRIQNPDNSSALESLKKQNLGSLLRRPGDTAAQPKSPVRVRPLHSGKGGFIKVTGPTHPGSIPLARGSRQNVVIQSSQIRRKTEDFSPILKSVETVQAELPSQILDIEDDLAGAVAMEIVHDDAQEIVTTQTLITDSQEEEVQTTSAVVVEPRTDTPQSMESEVTLETVEEQEVTGAQCIVQYVNENGEIIEVAEVTD